jgi:hypothetical protein
MKQTDNLEARAREWLRENHPYTHDVHEQITKLAAFARSLTPSGAVVEERPFPTDLHKVAREWTNKWCQTYSPHDQQAVAIALWELLEKQASNFASPSVEPTVDEQKTELQEAIKEIGKLQDQIKEMDNEIRGLNQVRNHYEG